MDDERIVAQRAAVRKADAEARLAEAAASNGNPDDRRAYAELVAHLAQSLRICVRVGDGITNGQFVPGDTPDHDFIELSRDDIAIIDDLRPELFTLSHEAGHWRSCRELGRNEAAYRPATNAIHARMRDEPVPRATAEQGRLFVAEELRAWQLGRELLDNVSYPHLEAYDAHAATKLEQDREIVSQHADAE